MTGRLWFLEFDGGAHEFNELLSTVVNFNIRVGLSSMLESEFSQLLFQLVDLHQINFPFLQFSLFKLESKYQSIQIWNYKLTDLTEIRIFFLKEVDAQRQRLPKLLDCRHDKIKNSVPFYCSFLEKDFVHVYIFLSLLWNRILGKLCMAGNFLNFVKF